jgi:hypothetical protein
VLALFFGQPCQSWFIARRDDGDGPCPLRDASSFLWGLPNLNPSDRTKVKLGNKLWLLTFSLACMAARRGVQVIIEDPKRIWLTQQVQYLMSLFKARFVEVNYCQFHMPWKKDTLFMCINCPAMSSCHKVCAGKNGMCSMSHKKHIQLVGKDSSGIWMTRRAQA